MVFKNLKERLIKNFIKKAFIDFRIEKITEEEKNKILNKVENATSLTDEQKNKYYKEYFEENLENETKSEMEKMKAGLPYTSMVPDLIYDRLQCKDFLDRYNSTKGADGIKRSKMLPQLFKHTGKGVFVERPITCEYGYNISMGDDCFMNYDCIILDNAEVTIGKHCLFGPRCQLITATHPIEYQERSGLCFDIAKPIRIGNECFFGANVTVVPGVTIGDNVVVGAGSVVTKDIPSNTVVCGNPAKPIRQLKPYVPNDNEE
ncbi:trimeric LpxA-like protein [Piromyces finnis]|uniref:Trimeric LpxA-like protein n=1 Tax=Piromyces finnis TaxID=1754191 RepID=A0A1Y1V844_9FUNG|nr:trimeric LpxA-like protein [Piromyces finnis]|eukprot:ORX48710.1 trimeric LpxA-like protein [Piromyces finnis]